MHKNIIKAYQYFSNKIIVLDNIKLMENNIDIIKYF
jgi:hypothetical protein